MKLFNLLIMFHNWLSDKDFIWWPFSFLRPEPHTSINFKLVGLMTLCFGGLSFTMFTIFAVINNAFTPQTSFATFLSCFGGFFIWFSTVTRPLWNIRARQLQGK